MNVGAEFLEQTYEFFGRNALRDFRVAQRLHDFGETSRRSFVVYAAAKQLRHVLSREPCAPLPLIFERSFIVAQEEEPREKER